MLNGELSLITLRGKQITKNNKLLKTYVHITVKDLNSNCIFGPESYYMAKVYFSLGSNQGDRLVLLVKAIKLIDILIGRVLLYSPVVESEPWGFEAETNFYNQAFLIETELMPQQVLAGILEIESILGRKRSGAGYASRSIDIDILFYDDKQINDDKLVIPHPLLHMRQFVLEPLHTIAPDHIHPVFNTTITDLLNQLNRTGPVLVAVGKDEFARLLNQ